ncbi:hypothetical protein L596_005320 [Steinernema carpocapsae]|uniref:Flavin-containing monooxygenase n=2 Tax=Steinernema carpocapsae TaxID=34508 RepID=A0A4U8UYR3_STECR|nr:hypothetical protein L596_005320 [Steinernema carpocapsae]
MKRVAIIGAGASGLPAIRHALLYGFEPVCFESADDIGGLWRYKPEETDESSVMKSTVINTSKEMTAYSDFPPPEEYANFMHNSQLLKYFRLYAKQFDLLKHIKFHHKVLNVVRAPSFEKDGKWTVVFLDTEGKQHEEEFDGVLVASGHHTTPHFPKKWPGQDEFEGKILHAHSYKDHRGFEDKVVVVVGVGNSGGDVAVELSRLTKQVYLVTRRGTWVFNRIFDFGVPFDLVFNTRINFILKQIVPHSMSEQYVISRLQKRFNHNTYGLRPKHGVFSAHPTVNDELPNRIACGTIRIKPNIKSFSKNNIMFEDNSCVENVDAVVLATGYSFSFPMIEQGKLIEVSENQVELYQYMYPLKTAKHNTLAVLGLIQPLGSIMPISELQARVFFDALSGSSRLPSETEMKQNINAKREEMGRRYVKSRRHTIQVDYNSYMDELAEIIGCKPSLKTLALSDPALAYKVTFGAQAPYQYRLTGPHVWEGAREALLTLDERVLKPTITQRTSAMTDSLEATDSVTCIATIVGLLAALIVFLAFVF